MTGEGFCIYKAKMRFYPDTARQQLQTFNWLGIFKHYPVRVSVLEVPPGPGKISPFGASFHELVNAVALKGKPIAEFDYEIYAQEKNVCDYIIQIYGVEKLDDPTNRCIWLFRHKNKADALKRIVELRNTPRENYKRKGELFGYSKYDIDKFISKRGLK